MATERLINIITPPFTSPLHLLVFGSTLLVYNAPRILRKAFADENNSRGLYRNYRFWYFIFFAAGAVMAVSSFFWLSWRILIASGILSIFAFAYSLPLLPLKKKKRLRDFGWLKIIVLATVWTVATSVLPLLYHNKNINSYPFEILLRFVLIFILCVVFDIRDMQTDLQNDLYTLPNKMGLTNSFRLINIMLVIFAGLSIVQYIRYPSLERLVGALLTAVTTRIVAGYLQRHPSYRAYMSLADGMMMLYSLLVMAPNL